MAFVMILVYLFAGQLVVERKMFETQAECQAAGGKRVTVINSDPKFENGYLAACVEVKVTQL